MDELPHRYLLQEIPYTLEVSLFSGSHIFLVVYSLFIADILYFSNNWTTLIWPFQGRLAHSQAACHMETGVARCRRSQSTAPPSSRKMPSHIQVSVKAKCLYQTFLLPITMIQVLAKNIGRFLQRREYGVSKFWPKGHGGHHRWCWHDKLGIILKLK